MAVWLGLMYLASSRPGGDLPLPTPDYLAHAAEFLVLGVLLLRALAGGIRPPSRRWTWGAVLALCIAVAVLDEFHQSFVPGRQSSAIDVVSDAVGAGLACVLFAVMTRPRRGGAPGGGAPG